MIKARTDTTIIAMIFGLMKNSFMLRTPFAMFALWCHLPGYHRQDATT
jgi:hypothetical protein